MRLRINRREVLIGAGTWACARTVGAGAGTDQDAAAAMAALELREGGLLGVMAVDTATGRRLEHRADERFPLCSTFKFLAAAAILHRVDRGRDHLDRWIAYGESDLLEYAPISKAHVEEGGMVLGDVCSAAVELSDNTAANLLLKILGGPEELTAFIRGVIWPPDRAPIVFAAFYIRNGTRLAQREGVLRDVGRIIARGI